MFYENRQKIRLILIWTIPFVLGLYIQYATAECNVCQSNQAACINTTSYYLCFGGNIPNMHELYHCKDGFDCTDLNAICVQSSSQRRPSCGDISLCGQCSAHRNHVFACLSRTTFQMCYGAIRPIGQIGYCPQGYVCDAKSDAVCVLEDLVDEVTCDIVTGEEGGNGGGEGSTTTPENGGGGDGETTTTTTSEPNGNLSPQQVCEKINQIGLYEPSPTDPYCKRYIYCFRVNGAIQGVEYNCSSGTYYHIQHKQCVFNKPTYCL
uniref:Putative secreted protein n=1 Tax=Haematobia irritans TaxID=7368 RepID=A0A1L8EIK8_HAEIR